MRDERELLKWQNMATALRALSLPEFNNMMNVFRKYCHGYPLSKFSDQQLAQIPKEVYMVHMVREIEWYWDRLPLSYQEDDEMQRYLRCREHYPTGSVEIDGPPPLKKDCIMCMRGEAAAANRRAAI